MSDCVCDKCQCEHHCNNECFECLECGTCECEHCEEEKKKPYDIYST